MNTPKMVQAWGVFRNDRLISTVLGITEQDAKDMVIALEKFMRGEKYQARAIPGKRIPVIVNVTTEGK